MQRLLNLPEIISCCLAVQNLSQVWLSVLVWGVYFLPILTAEKGLSETGLAELTSGAQVQT